MASQFQSLNESYDLTCARLSAHFKRMKASNSVKIVFRPAVRLKNKFSKVLTDKMAVMGSFIRSRCGIINLVPVLKTRPLRRPRRA